MGTAALIDAGHDPQLVQRVIRMVDAAEYKRRQYPPGPKITQKNFGRDRRAAHHQPLARAAARRRHAGQVLTGAAGRAGAIWLPAGRGRPVLRAARAGN